MSNVFVNNAFVVNQNTNTYTQYVDQGTYDYIFNINMNPMAESLTDLFINATYIQNSLDVNNYNINLVLSNTTHVNWYLINNQNIITIEIGNSTTGFLTLNSDIPQTFGERLLEIVAHKIFGHGQARVAISNDSEFFTHDAQLWNHLVNTVATNSFRHDIFNQYVDIGRYTNRINEGNYDDINQYINFNFNSLSIDFPMYFIGNILLNNNLLYSQANLFQNGVNVGGTTLVNGLYNIPILIKMHT